jgi:tryptophan 2,3-dioxygenase
VADDMTYQDYLELDTLLSLQSPRTAGTGASESTVLSERFFIVAHQASELWLQQLILDLEAVLDAFTTSDDSSSADWIVDVLHRAAATMSLLQNHILVLDRLPVRDFATFRAFLGTSSGAQSAQFHRLSHLLGHGDKEGPLYESFAAWVARSGLDLTELAPCGTESGVHYRIIDALLDLGNNYWRWQTSHICLITKVLGDHAGTAGTEGANHLLRHCTLPFPELRRLRGRAHLGHSVDVVAMAND